MPLDPYLAERAQSIQNLEDVWGDPESASLLEEWNTDPSPWVAPENIQISDNVIPGPHGDIPIRIYQGSDDAPGVLMWSHGGGFSYGDLDMREAHVPSAELCGRTGWTVVSIDYRLANDGVHYPIPLDDVSAAWNWVASGLGSGRATAIGGASAGAALSLSATMRARDTGGSAPDVILLAYPFSHFPSPQLDDDLACEIAQLPPALRIEPHFIEEIVRNYVGRISDIPALAVPGSGDLRGLPPVRIIVAELDDLRASGELLQRQIGDVGGDASLYLASGMVHGHLDRHPTLPEVDRSLDYFADALRSV